MSDGPKTTKLQAGDPILSPTFIKRGEGWLRSSVTDLFVPPNFEFVPKIEMLADRADKLGPQPLWSGYAELRSYPTDTRNTTRRANSVRTKTLLGRTYTWLAQQRAPDAIVEFGTAFGVSGMFWLAGLELARSGTLFTFEPNRVWAEIAQDNLKAISNRFVLTVGTFEDNAARVLKAGTVGIGFIDAIHTAEFVYSQYAILKQYLMPGAIVVFDDISFSAGMKECWLDIARQDDVVASLTFGTRVGLIEIR